MDNTLSAEIQQRLTELQALFHAQLPGRIAEMQQCWKQLKAQWQADELSRLHHICHSLAGSAGTFGAHELGDAARELDLLLKRLMQGPATPDTRQMAQLQSLLDRLLAAARAWRPQ